MISMDTRDPKQPETQDDAKTEARPKLEVRGKIRSKVRAGAMGNSGHEKPGKIGGIGPIQIHGSDFNT